MDIAFAGFSLKVRERLLSGPGGPVEIGARAIDVLHVLLEKHSEVVSKDELLSTVWPGSIVEENALQAQISALRKSSRPEPDRHCPWPWLQVRRATAAAHRRRCADNRTGGSTAGCRCAAIRNPER